MSMFPKAIALLAAALLVSGCATNSPLAEQLQASTTRERIIFSERASFVRLQGVFNVPWEYGLMPGTYVAEKENKLGTFYRGTGRAIWARDKQETRVQLFVGGIWVPKRESEVPRLYVVRDNIPQTTNDLDQYTRTYSQNLIAAGHPVGSSVGGAVIGGAIVEAVLRAEAGTIYIFDPSEDPKFDGQMKAAYKSRLPSD